MVKNKTKKAKLMPPKNEPVAAPEPVKEPSPADGLSVADRKKFDQLVREKVSCGLPRSDAEEVARRQINEDKAAAKK